MIKMIHGIATVEGDTHHAGWIQTSGRLVHDEFMASHILKHIKPGMVVVDGGANIGTLTQAMIEAGATVHAFEPNREAFKCLVRNCPSAAAYPYALTDRMVMERIKLLPNVGASYLTTNDSDDGCETVTTATLDDFKIKDIGFIKLDVEGCEVQAIKGAAETIKRCRPTMIVEVNPGALLRRDGSTAEDLVRLIEGMGYSVTVVQPGLEVGCPQCDVLCVPV